ncbi:C-terminal binding protein [Thozetella sp. PMI_491]|nr:C-terminal binding protein [Thozetella sp. PMI_491]
MASEEVPTYTILQGDGLYPDDSVEQEIFSREPSHTYKVNYVQADLLPGDSPVAKPWSSIPEELRNKVDGILILKLYFTEEDIALFPRLKVVVRMGVGYDRMDRPALAKRGILLCNVPDAATGDIADHAFGLALSLRRGVLLHNDLQRGSNVAPWCYVDTPLISRLDGATFGILGLGRVGTAAALRAKAFGWKVLFYDPHVPNGADKALGVERTKDIKELFRRSTTLSIHCSCTVETRNMVGWELIGLMPRNSILVNTARGEVVQLDAIERGLREGILSGVGLDVLPQEPVDEQNVPPLIKAYREKEEWLQGRMVLTSHSAFFTPESYEEIRSKSAETMRDVLIDGVMSNIITIDMF